MIFCLPFSASSGLVAEVRIWKPPEINIKKRMRPEITIIMGTRALRISVVDWSLERPPVREIRMGRKSETAVSPADPAGG